MCFQKVFFIDGISQTSLYFLLLLLIVIFTGFYYTSIWQKMQENNIFYLPLISTSELLYKFSIYLFFCPFSS